MDKDRDILHEALKEAIGNYRAAMEAEKRKLEQAIEAAGYDVVEINPLGMTADGLPYFRLDVRLNRPS
jgi:TRAP-type C4-dicarboxylate transport system substrate-binding protein